MKLKGFPGHCVLRGAPLAFDGALSVADPGRRGRRIIDGTGISFCKGQNSPEKMFPMRTRRWPWPRSDISQ